jgi:hypothetical protein
MPKDRIGGHIDFVVTEGGRPGPQSTFIEVEDAAGRSNEVGGWVERREGEWALRVPYAGLEQIIADLYDSEINASFSWFWDGGIDVSIGDDLNGFVTGDQVATLAEDAEWLRASAVEHYPDSEFARKHARGFE